MHPLIRYPPIAADGAAQLKDTATRRGTSGVPFGRFEASDRMVARDRRKDGKA